jgi:uncharacterized coiled-coil protein SlyX
VNHRRARQVVSTALCAAAVLAAACGGRNRPANPRPTTSRPIRSAAETVTVRDPEMEQRSARLELRLLEKDAQLEELQSRLDEARREVVRSMAKLQSLATRAEAASGMAEAELALQSLRSTAGQQGPPEVAQSARLLEMSTGEFNRENYAGALYLANQAKIVAGTGRGRLLGVDRGSLRSGEVLFSLPLRLQASGRSNVRDGPGPGFRVAFTVTAGMPLTGHSYLADWVRISDDSSRSGWIHQSRIDRRP